MIVKTTLKTEKKNYLFRNEQKMESKYFTSSITILTGSGGLIHITFIKNVLFQGGKNKE